MGWNSWNHFGTRINAATVREIADAMVSSGMRDAGYQFVNIDDGWQGERDQKGIITANERFGDMKALAAYVHSKDLRFGLYSSPGPQTCAKYEGSYGHEVQDATTYGDWAVDYLKYDWCSATRIYPDPVQMRAAFKKMGDALSALDRPIVYSISQGGRQQVWTWAPQAGAHLWRTTHDIEDSWTGMSEIGFDENKDLYPYAGPGHWNDPDMLEVGNGGMTADEYRVHFSLWSLLAAPLLAGNDVRHMDETTRSILLNREVIAIDQDKLGKQGKQFRKDGELEIWTRELTDGFAIGLFNRGMETASMTARWTFVGLPGKRKVRDLWASRDLGRLDDHYTANVAPHSVVLLKIYK